MPITRTSVFKKHQYEYTSPDGEIYDITFVEHGDRMYLQFQKIDPKQKPDEQLANAVTVDWEMWSEIYGEIDKLLNPNNTVRKGGKGLKSPALTDRRQEETISDTPAQIIDRKVAETMKRQDSNVRPLESFSPPPAVTDDGFNYDVERAGVDPSALPPVGDTPSDFVADESIQEEIERRKAAGKDVRPNIVKGDESDQGGFRRAGGYKRISPSDLV